jgi:hypothetical protein
MILTLKLIGAAFNYVDGRRLQVQQKKDAAPADPSKPAPKPMPQEHVDRAMVGSLALFFSLPPRTLC